MSEYIPHTPEDQRQMLQAIGLRTLEDLFSDIPKTILDHFEPVGLNPLSELEIKQHFNQLASKNVDSTQFISFLGGGIYDHHVPSVVNHLITRSEFFTSYTPYQAEASQGTLTWMFEFQTLICELTGMDVANASMYDGGSALAEAMLMAHHHTGSTKFLVAKSVHPHFQQIIGTYAWAADFRLVKIPQNERGQLDLDFIRKHANDKLGGVLVQTPNFFGIIEDLSGIKEMIGNALLCVSAHPLALGVIKSPGEFGADIVVSEGQVLGNAPNFGGPLVGLFGCKQAYLRKMPGRISGRTSDHDGNIGYVMTLQTREQHIKRAKATSNICTNQALCALATTIYLATLGKKGFRELAELNVQKAHYLARELQKISGVSLKWPASPFFNEFAIELPKKAASVLKKLRKHGILGGIDLSPHRFKNTLLIAVTEKRRREELDKFVQALQEVLG
jgi:glycine dehydrogenase subunit 1